MFPFASATRVILETPSVNVEDHQVSLQLSFCSMVALFLERPTRKFGHYAQAKSNDSVINYLLQRILLARLDYDL